MRVTFYAIWYNLPVYYTFPALGKALTGSICPSFEYFLPVQVFTNGNTQRPVFRIGQISLGVWFAIIKAEVWLIRVYNKKVRNDIVKKLRYFKNLEQSRDNWETN